MGFEIDAVYADPRNDYGLPPADQRLESPAL